MQELIKNEGGEMTEYYVNKTAQDNGDHEVHKLGCYWLSLVKNKGSLGNFSSCHGAVTKARKKYPKADGCKHCSLACHKK